MKIKQLHLKAIGPFSDRVLDFGTSALGLHIVFGANEAGKSSSLRALKALLFGFPQQTPDNFIHSYDQLRVGGCLENSSGEQICFQRRKKRKGDLIDEAGNVLDDGALSSFLPGLEPALFESLYGIDHDTLVQGGEEILARKGDVGQALFAAGAGISSLGAVIEDLEKESMALFKPAGTKPEINQAVRRFKDLKKELRSATLSSREWTVHQKNLKTAMAKRSDLEKERDENNKELQALERLTQAIPELATLNSRQEQLQALGPVVTLPPDFVQRHQQVSQDMREASKQLDQDTRRLHELETRYKAISLNMSLLNQAGLVDDFHQRLGEYRKGQKDRPERNGMRISLKREAAFLLQQVRPDLSLDDVETLRPVIARKRTVQTLTTTHQAIIQRLNQAEKSRKRADQERGVAATKLAGLPEIKDVSALVQALKPAHRAGDLDAQLEKMAGEVVLNKTGCVSSLKQMGLWTGELSELMDLSLPLAETVQGFEKEYALIADDRRGIENDRKKAEKELKKVLSQIKKAAYAGDVPSERLLTRTREKREQGWQLLRRQWIEKEDITRESLDYDENRALPEAYETYVYKADHMADRLRREAERVAGVAALCARQESLEEALADNAKEFAVLDLRAKDLHDAWMAVWHLCGITPLSPREMGAWLSKMDQLRFKVGDLVKKEHDLARELRHRKTLKLAIEKELGLLGCDDTAMGEQLSPVVMQAETVLEKMTTLKNSHETLKERLENAEKAFLQADADLQSAHLDLDAWQAQWEKALLALGLKESVSTAEAIDLIETLKNCFDRLKEADDLKKRINGIDRDALALQNEFTELVTCLCPDLLGMPLEKAILHLRDLLHQAQKDAVVHEKLSEELTALKADVATANSLLQTAEQQMKTLLEIARCDAPDELATVMEKYLESQRLREKISDTQALLAKIGAGVPVDEFMTQAAAVNADELPGRISSLLRDIDERINPEINRISQIIGEETVLLAAMDGSDSAAEIAGKMEQELSRIKRLSERYATLRMAARILQQEIERYRETHQDPVLKMASTYFNTLTLGSFAGLRTDVDDKGGPVLVGVRPDDFRLTVDKMSAGTRDQLFLALRLATLVCRLETAEPMPFIVDDILINFDDDRSKATLSVLSELALNNQVIVFTHHQRIVEEARQMSAGGGVQIHEL
ncbi:AAA family ATPase [Desulfocicer niacini]